MKLVAAIILSVTSLLVPLSFGLAQSFASLLLRINSELNSGRRSATIDSLMSAIKQFPYIEDSTAYFIYRGDAESVKVVGDFNSWNPTDAPVMTNLVGTNFFYHRQQFEMDARLDYKFIVNDTDWTLDPLNPRTIVGGYGPNSELPMPGYVQPVEVYDNLGIQRGQLTAPDSVFSESLNSIRAFRVYLPPGYETSATCYPTLYVHDGYDYISLGSMNLVLDHLIAFEKIEPLIVVFVPPGNRVEEYVGSRMNEHRIFMAEELRAHIDTVYRTIDDAGRRAIMGASAGGFSSIYVGFRNPEVFGLVASQSGYAPDSLLDTLRVGPVKPLRFYIDVGTYDLPSFLASNGALRDSLVSRGYRVERYQEFHEGHSWGNWRAHLDDVLTTFFPSGRSLHSGSKSNAPN
ncbi:MAG: alpha/beta hydrolase-fold protein [Bacteroidota bacterium]